MRRLAVTAAFALAALSVVVAVAAAGTRTNVIYDSTAKNGPPSNMPSLGAEAYAFASLGDEVAFASGPRKLSTVTVTLSSWACVQGTWFNGDCVTPTGATFSLPLTLNIYDDTGTTLLASSTQTFAVPYRPSASARCGDGRWYSNPLKTCFNGFADDVTFGFGGNVTLPDTVVYELSYNTSHYGPSPVGEGAACFGTEAGCPYDSLNIALNTSTSAGTDVFSGDVWQNGARTTIYDSSYTPAVQFKASGGS
ncbi:MAG TPA: hypothetical protein VGH82_17400 [Gaiellaceae bacterium]|jgi:hypothetical protein